MGRQDTLATMLGFVGPLGPLGNVEERDRRQELWAMEAGPGIVDDLVDLAIHPPRQSELGRISPDEFEYALSRVLALIGARDAAGVLQRVGPLIGIPAARPTIIEVIGAIGAQEGLAWIAPLVQAPGLTEEEGTRLACAIGEINGPQAHALLELLRTHTPAGHRRAIEEIEIALELLRAR